MRGALSKMDPESPVIEHHLEAHQDKESRISMKLVSKEQRPLDRKILEGCLIAENREGQLMNRRGEWGQNLPPKIGIIGVEDSEYGLKKKRVREVVEEATDREEIGSPRKRAKVKSTKAKQTSEETILDIRGQTPRSANGSLIRESVINYFKQINSKAQHGENRAQEEGNNFNSDDLTSASKQGVKMSKLRVHPEVR